MAELARRGHDAQSTQLGNLRDARALLDFDVLLAWRMHDDEFLRIARMVIDAGVPLVWDNDDDLRSIDTKDRAKQRHFGGYSGHRIFRSMVSLMRLSRIVTTPSPTLATIYREASGADVRVIENHVASVSARAPPRWGPTASGPVTIGWVANREHQMDIERLRLDEPFQRLLDEVPDVKVISVGCRLGLKGDRYTHVRGMLFEDLPGVMQQFDIGIAPIADTSFNQARSNIKVKEYAALGIPWLASPIGPYAVLGERHGGRLVPDDRWYEALRDLAGDARARRKLARRGIEWAKAETIGANAHQWEAVLAEAVGSGASHARSPRASAGRRR
ncbi:MAG TPA: glycosyltransferase [Conexibacter sp.]|nr:glycosyltransferase [Conexibacter sp.]